MRNLEKVPVFKTMDKVILILLHTLARNVKVESAKGTDKICEIMLIQIRSVYRYVLIKTKNKIKR